MADSLAKSGHSIILEVAPSPGTAFVTIAELRGDITEGQHTRETKDVTPHGASRDTHVFSPVEKRAPLSGQGNFIASDASHDDSSEGLKGLMAAGTIVALGFRGPSYSARVLDHKIMSGAFTALEVKGGQGANEFNFTFTFQPSGGYEMDGIAYAA